MIILAEIIGALVLIGAAGFGTYKFVQFLINKPTKRSAKKEG